MAQRAHLSPRGLRRLICGIDWLTRRLRGIIEFDGSEDGLIRIAFGRAEQEVRLADGTCLEPGDAVVELHLWNEHLLRMPLQGSRFRWATAMRRRATESLRRLAAHMLEDHRFAGIKALRAEPAPVGGRPTAVLAHIMTRHGFEAALDDGAAPGRSWFFRLFDNLWIWLLAWTYNPVSLKSWRSGRRRRVFWISRARFLALYGGRVAGSATGS